jgi:hypothetical protein
LDTASHADDDGSRGQRGGAVPRTRCGNVDKIGLWASLLAFWWHSIPAPIAIGDEKADREDDGKCNKTFEYWIVVHHDGSHGVG